MRDVDQMSDIEVARLLAAIFPTRVERVLQAVVTSCYRRSYTGLFGWVGDRADDLRCRLQWRRARLGRHLAGRRQS